MYGSQRYGHSEDQDIDGAVSFFKQARTRSSAKLADNIVADLESSDERPKSIRVRALVMQAHKHAVLMHSSSFAPAAPAPRGARDVLSHVRGSGS